MRSHVPVRDHVHRNVYAMNSSDTAVSDNEYREISRVRSLEMSLCEIYTYIYVYTCTMVYVIHASNNAVGDDDYR